MSKFIIKHLPLVENLPDEIFPQGLVFRNLITSVVTYNRIRDFVVRGWRKQK